MVVIPYMGAIQSPVIVDKLPGMKYLYARDSALAIDGQYYDFS